MTEELRSSVLLNHRYQEENVKLKSHLIKIHNRLEEYKRNFDKFKQKFTLEKNIISRENFEFDHMKRLRHELEVYRQVIEAKRKEEMKSVNYFYRQY